MVPPMDPRPKPSTALGPVPNVIFRKPKRQQAAAAGLEVPLSFEPEEAVMVLRMAVSDRELATRARARADEYLHPRTGHVVREGES
jgi:hypothetical protein